MPHIHQGDSEFYIEQDGEKAAKITFFLSENGNLVIEHTEVSETLAGQGIGKKLVQEVVNKARAENKKIIPQCGYAERQLEKNEEYHDVLGV